MYIVKAERVEENKPVVFPQEGGFEGDTFTTVIRTDPNVSGVAIAYIQSGEYKNAKELEDHGACVIITEEDFSSKTIIQKVEYLLDHKDVYDKMSQCSRELGIDDSSTRIYEEIKKLVR